MFEDGVLEDGVLVVEDNDDLRETLCDMLECEGLHACRAANGAAALELLRAGVHPKVIVLDLMMPVMTGYEFLRERDREPHARDVPVVVVSAVSGEEPPPGAVAAFAKPFEADGLLRRVKELYAQAA